MRAPTVRIGEVGADAFIGPCRAAASRGGRGSFVCPFVPLHPKAPLRASPKALRALGEAWAGTFSEIAPAPRPSGRAMRAPTPGVFGEPL